MFLGPGCFWAYAIPHPLSTYYLSADLGGIIINPIVGIILDSVGFQFMYLTMLIPVAIAAVVFTVIMATMGDRYARKSEISAS